MKVINTKTIGEKILLLERGERPEDIPAQFRDLIIYRASEIKVIKDRNIAGEELLMLHGIKKEFPGSEIKLGPGTNYIMDMQKYQPLYRKEKHA